MLNVGTIIPGKYLFNGLSQNNQRLNLSFLLTTSILSGGILYGSFIAVL